MTDAKELKKRICILMLHLFISCSINYPLCAELILKKLTFSHSDYVYIIFSILHVNHIPIIICRVFWAGDLSLHLYI